MEFLRPILVKIELICQQPAMTRPIRVKGVLSPAVAYFSSDLRTSSTPCLSQRSTAAHSGPTWPRSSTLGLSRCWAGMSFPSGGAPYRWWRTLSPAEGTRTRQRQRQRHRLHGKRTSRRPKRPLPLKTSARPQRPLHPKRTAGRRRRIDGASGVGSPRTRARRNPSLASIPGPPPRRRRHRRRPRRRGPAPANAITARVMVTPRAAASTRPSAHSAADRIPALTASPSVKRASRPAISAISAWRKVTAAGPDSVRIVHDRRRSPSPRTPRKRWMSLPSPPATPPPRLISPSSVTFRPSNPPPETMTSSANVNGSRTPTPWPWISFPTTLSVKSRSSSPTSTRSHVSRKPWSRWTLSTAVRPTAAVAETISTRSPPGTSTPSTPAYWTHTTTSGPPGRSTPSPSQRPSRPSWPRGRASRWLRRSAPAIQRSSVRDPPPACLRTPPTPSRDEPSAGYEPCFLSSTLVWILY